MSEQSTTAVLVNLLARFRAGDADAKRALVERAYDRLLLLARGHLRRFPDIRREEESAAILNAAYARISKALDDVRPTTVLDFLGLVSLQMRRVLLDISRKGHRGSEPPPAVQGGLGAPERSAGGGADPEAPDGEPAGGLRSDILDALDNLPDDERVVVELIFFHGLTQVEIGEILNLHPDTVKRRWAAARVKLAGQLADYAPPA
jgi:RNA polymerase sigma factor (sigma-70 family)